MRDESGNNAASVRLLMMQRNEGELLRVWAIYHAALVGTGAITVFDNGSDDPATLAVVSDLRRKGFRIIDRPGRAAFEGKGEIFSDIIAAEPDTRRWFIPMDCDEFLCGFDGVAPVCLERVVDRFAGIPETVGSLRITKSLFNHPHAASGYPEAIQKVALRGGEYVRLDTGFHCYDWGSRRCLLDPARTMAADFGFVHIHNKPFTQLVQAARRKLEGRVCFDPDVLAAYRGPGAHLAPYLLMDEASYLASFSRRVSVDFSKLFEASGLGVPYAASRGKLAA